MRTVGWACSLLIALGLVLAAYALRPEDHHAQVGSPIYPGDGPLPKGGGRYVVGKPYEISGRWYSPAEQPGYDEVGIASWYGPQFHRRQTSNGEWFDMDYLTAAHTTLPLPSYVKVTNLENGIGLVVRINDRGPFVGDRIIDLSRSAAEKLAFKGQGTARVRVQYLGPAPLNDKGTHLAAMNRALKRGAPTGEIAVAASAKRRLAAASLGSAAHYFVQVGWFAHPDNAKRARLGLARIGPVEISPSSDASGTFYRVRVGPLRDKNEAQAALQQVINAGHADARLVLPANTL